MDNNKKAAPEANRAASDTAYTGPNSTPPMVSGQCALVLEIIRTQGHVVSFTLTAIHAIPEAAARVHDLRAKGFNVQTQILPEYKFRGRIRRNVALYSLGTPAWPRPGFMEGK